MECTDTRHSQPHTTCYHSCFKSMRFSSTLNFLLLSISHLPSPPPHLPISANLFYFHRQHPPHRRGGSTWRKQQKKTISWSSGGPSLLPSSMWALFYQGKSGAVKRLSAGKAAARTNYLKSHAIPTTLISLFIHSFMRTSSFSPSLPHPLYF